MSFAAAQKLLDDASTTFGVPGAQLGLLRKSSRIVVCTGVRAIDEPYPVLPTTPFHAGSLAKSLTALLVVDAARRGELDLDRPGREQAPGTWSDTPRAIMSSVTGRPNLLPEFDEGIGAFVTRVADLPRVHAPGRFSYCNPGWPALDLLLRHCSGGDFETLARRRILNGHGRFGRPDDAAAGHEVVAGGAPQPNAGEVGPAASAAGSRWWATADELLDLAELHLTNSQGRFHPDDVAELRRPHAPIPGATVADAWGLGWALWDRGEHQAFGWSGFTAGHRAYLRCFPRQQAAVVLLANAAGPLTGPPGGSALFDTLLPRVLELLGVPELPPAVYGPEHDTAELAGIYGPVTLQADGPDGLLMEAAAFGVAEPLRHVRRGGDTFEAVGDPPGGMPVAVEDGLLYVGPFALPRAG